MSFIEPDFFIDKVKSLNPQKIMTKLWREWGYTKLVNEKILTDEMSKITFLKKLGDKENECIEERDSVCCTCFHVLPILTPFLYPYDPASNHFIISYKHF